MRLRPELLCVLLPAFALAEPRSLTVVPHPLEFDPRPELTASGDKLKGAWIEAVREAGDVITPSRREVDAALGDVGRKDCRTANDCLAALAVKGAGLYAVYALLELSEGGVFTVSARVVRDDGKLMASFSASAPRGEKKRPLVPLVKQLLVDAVKGLGVAGLPAFKEAVVAAPPVVKPAEPPPPPPPVVTPPPEVVAPVEPVATPVGRVVGFSLLGVGVAAAAAGGVLVALAQGSARSLLVDARGFLPAGADADALERARAANGRQVAGLVLLGAGGAVAVGGLVLALLSGSSSPPPVSLVPVAGGVVATLGGPWP
jgi:hypothetical protein